MCVFYERFLSGWLAGGWWCAGRYYTRQNVPIVLGYNLYFSILLCIMLSAVGSGGAHITPETVGEASRGRECVREKRQNDVHGACPCGVAADIFRAPFRHAFADPQHVHSLVCRLSSDFCFFTFLCLCCLMTLDVGRYTCRGLVRHIPDHQNHFAIVSGHPQEPRHLHHGHQVSRLQSSHVR
jgi:hypothetical protein